MLSQRYFLVLVILAALFNVVIAQDDNNRGGGGNNRNETNNGNNNGNNGNNNNDNDDNGGDNNGDELQLDPNLVQDATKEDGNAQAADGQSASDTDNANFINFCGEGGDKTLTNGKQETGGSCNGIVMGDIPATENMISTIILNPKAGDDIEPDTDFNVDLQVDNLVAGSFTNPDNTYYSAPQQLQDGKVVGHTHVTIQSLGDDINSQKPPDPNNPDFFKGVNDPGDGQGGLSAAVDGGLPAGVYRVCTMTSSSNHQPVLMPVAQRGAQDDCQKFTVGQGNGNNNNGDGNNNNNNNNNENNGNNGNKNNGTDNNGGNNGGDNGGQNRGQDEGQNREQDGGNNGDNNGGQNKGQDGGQNRGQNGGKNGTDGNGDDKKGGNNGKGNDGNGDRNRGQDRRNSDGNIRRIDHGGQDSGGNQGAGERRSVRGFGEPRGPGKRSRDGPGKRQSFAKRMFIS